MLNELHTRRLLLRPVRPGDVDDVLEYASEAAWSRYLHPLWFPHPFERSNAQDFVARNTTAQREDETNLAIEYQGRMIGSVHLMSEPEPRVAELAYLVARSHWGMGVASEAAAAMLEHAFVVLDLATVFATADAENRASTGVMRRLGMRQTGFHRDHRLGHRGERRHGVRYEIRRSGWLARRGADGPAP